MAITQQPFTTPQPGAGKVYVFPWRGALMSVTEGGGLFRTDRDGVTENLTKAPITGGSRCVFAEADDRLLMAAGGQLIYTTGGYSEVLSEDAPLSTHVGYLNGYVLALDPGSQRWRYSEPGIPGSWPADNIFAAESRPDKLTSLFVTEYGEAMFGGEKSIEQWEANPDGDRPFFQRWSIGEGVFAPHIQMEAASGVFVINRERELIRVSGQTARPNSGEVALSLQEIDNWDHAWGSDIQIKGQKFMLIQAPEASNVYGTEGVTLVFDYRNKKWFHVYGWDEAQALPARWPGWSYAFVQEWNRHFVGGEDGVIYELDANVFDNAGIIQRVRTRTAHLMGDSRYSVEGFRMTVRRGVGGQDDATVAVRVSRDNKPFSRWIRRSLGKAGDRPMVINFGAMGTAYSFQFEWDITDAVGWDLRKVEMQKSMAE